MGSIERFGQLDHLKKLVYSYVCLMFKGDERYVEFVNNFLITLELIFGGSKFKLEKKK